VNSKLNRKKRHRRSRASMAIRCLCRFPRLCGGEIRRSVSGLPPRDAELHLRNAQPFIDWRRRLEMGRPREMRRAIRPRPPKVAIRSLKRSWVLSPYPNDAPGRATSSNPRVDFDKRDMRGDSDCEDASTKRFASLRRDFDAIDAITGPPSRHACSSLIISASANNPAARFAC